MVEERVVAEFGGVPGYRVWYGSPPASMRPHWHDQVEINYCWGKPNVRARWVDSNVPPGRLSLFWAGMPHGVLRRTRIEKFYWIYAPLVWILHLGLPSSFMRRLMTGEMIIDDDPLEADRVMLDRWSDELPHADLSRRYLIMWEVEARVMRLALAQGGETSDRHVSSADGQMQKVSEMACLIAENYAEPLRPKDVARHVGLHPNYAMTLFRQHYGMTLNTYLTRVRICQAQFLLISTDRDVSQIAFETGFGSISRFYDVFKAMSGHTPRPNLANNCGFCRVYDTAGEFKSEPNTVTSATIRTQNRQVKSTSRRTISGSRPHSMDHTEFASSITNATEPALKGEVCA